MLTESGHATNAMIRDLELKHNYYNLDSISRLVQYKQ